MAAPAPETKPKFRMTAQAAVFDTFEVRLRPEESAPGIFTPRPRMAYTQEDAVLALAEMLKAHGITPVEFLETLQEAPLKIAQVRLLECDGKHFEYSQATASSTHEVITSRLTDYYPMASKSYESPAIPTTSAPVEAQEIPMTFPNGGSRGQATKTASTSAPKVRKVTTVYGSDSGSKQEQLQAAMAQLTPEMVAKGAVIVMGKDGPRILNPSGARTEEEEGEALADAEESGVLSGDDDGSTSEVIHLPLVPAADPKPTPEAPAPRPVPVIRTMSGVEAERSLQATALDHHDQEAADTSEMDHALRTQLRVAADAPEVRVSPVVLDEAAESTAQGLTHVEEVGGGRRVKRQDVTRKDRGGSRPVRPKA